MQGVLYKKHPYFQKFSSLWQEGHSSSTRAIALCSEMHLLISNTLHSTLLQPIDMSQPGKEQSPKMAKVAELKDKRAPEDRNLTAD